jgi:hypothetical protein
MDVLCQTGSCATFVSHYHEPLVDLDINQSLKIEYFCKCLKDNVQDVLALIKKQDIPIDFKKYVDLCVSIDNFLHYHKHEKKTSKNTSNSSPSTKHSFISPPTPLSSNTPPVAPTITAGTPMEIDATKTSCPHASLSKKEHEHCHHEGLCSYCGGKHVIDNCPNMSKHAKKALATCKALPTLGKA